MKIPCWLDARQVDTFRSTLPAVVAAIRDRLAAGLVDVTRRKNCCGIPGYTALRRYYTHAELLEMARGAVPLHMPEGLS